MSRRARRARLGLPHAGAHRSVGLPLRRRRQWHNNTGNQAIDPVGTVSARSVDDLVRAVNRARDEELTIRCVGSGHSWSDVALTTGYLVPPQDLSGVERCPAQLLRPGVDGQYLVSVGSGTRIHELNAWLDRNGLALQQMGGYDGQTLAGVVSTSTHGSGVKFGPFPDFVRSVDLVDGTGQPRRIEPAEGPTDRTAFGAARPAWTLDQRDDWFDAVTCAMGCMGLMVSLIIEVGPSFELTEVRRLSTWAQVRADLRAGILQQEEHYEVYVNPYALHGPGSNRCIVTTRRPPHGNRGADHRPVIPELLGHMPWVTSLIMNTAGAFAPRLIPRLLDYSLAAIKSDGYTNKSYLVFNIGSVNNLRAYSAEMGVPTANDGHVKAVEAVLGTAERFARDGSIYHTSPISLRFVAPSRAVMSMMHGQETMMIELIQLVDTYGGVEILAAHQDALAPLGVRAHWGQINTLGPEELAARYPGLPAWETVRRELDPRDVFASPFSKRVGITARAAVR
jgi:FAD/FMN-containing dehydrogenase